MTALWVLAIVLLCLLFLSLLRVGGRVCYDQNGLLVQVRVGVFSFTVFPLKPSKKAKKSPKEKPVPKSGPPREEPTGGGNLELLQKMLPAVCQAAGRLKKNIQIDDLELELLWSHPDPAVCAMGYGAANGAVGMIWPILEQNFHIKKYRIRTGVDFDRGSPTIRGVAALSLTVGQGISMTLRLLGQLLQIRRNSRAASEPSTTQQKKEAV